MNAVVQLVMDPIMEAGMKKQALFETVPAPPALTEDEPARELLAGEISIDGMRGVC
ncbi:MAG TPA: hypothetical protein VGK33_23330 [Chloroflexota bacterium]